MSAKRRESSKSVEDSEREKTAGFFVSPCQCKNCAKGEESVAAEVEKNLKKREAIAVESEEEREIDDDEEDIENISKHTFKTLFHDSVIANKIALDLQGETGKETYKKNLKELTIIIFDEKIKMLEKFLLD